MRHIENLANMAKQGLFVYKGRGNAADATFVSGECAMVTGSSALYGNIKRNAKFASGISTLPYYPDVPGAPQNTVIGGASLWVMSGKKPEEYKGVAAFFDYLSKPEVAAASHKRTGYLPVTMPSFELTEKSGFYKENPGTDVSVTQMIRKTTDKSRGIRLGNFVQIRTIIDEEMEQIWNGKKTAKEGLDSAVKRGNEQLERFEKANKSQADAARRGDLGRRKARSLQELVVALGADRTADGDHPGLLLLAGRPGASTRAFCSRTPSAPRPSSSGCRTSGGYGTTRPTSRRSGPRPCSRCWSRRSAWSIALLLAVMADRVIRGATIYKTLLIWPYAVAPAVAGVLWLFMFAPSVGIVSLRLRCLGVEWNHLLNANHAMALIVMAAVWKQVSYNFLFFLAGLQSIPKSLIEAAAIDGARPWRRFWTIVFPLLSPVTFFLLVINIIYAFFETFAIVDTATQGGPGKATSILVYQLYYDGFKALDLGGSAAQSVVLMVIVVTLTVIQFRYVEKNVQYR